MNSDIQVLGKTTPQVAQILTQEALAFVADLAKEFEPTRRILMNSRAARQKEIAEGAIPDFLSNTANVRNGDWRVAAAPKDLIDRRVELTGPSADRRMVINALNSGAQVYMIDFEDAHSPHWSRTMDGQTNLRDAVNGSIRLVTSEGKEYSLGEETATLVVRPRGLHLMERHLLVDGQPVSGSFFDFGISLFHNARTQLEAGTGPYFYLPKLQSYLEARLWNEVFNWAQDRLKISRGSIKTTVLIEHILAAFEMEEILYELRDHITGLNLGRWDYIFSFIKTFSQKPDSILPDRSQVSMSTHFLSAVAELLVSTCHKRGAHALGGMSTYIPRRDDPDSNEKALSQVRIDKGREAFQGFDGAWVAHPGLIPVVKEVFQQAFEGPHQLSRLPEVQVGGQDLLVIPQGEITEAGVRNNISVALQYVDAWIRGNGAVAIFGLMEDTATAEISRSQLWQWIRHGAYLSDGRQMTEDLYISLRTEEVSKLLEGREGDAPNSLDKAVELLDYLIVEPTFTEFLTIPGYRFLE